MPDVPDDPIAVSAATGSAAATNRSGPQDAISAAAGSGAKPGVSGLDSNAGRQIGRAQQRPELATQATATRVVNCALT